MGRQRQTSAKNEDKKNITKSPRVSPSPLKKKPNLRTKTRPKDLLLKSREKRASKVQKVTAKTRKVRISLEFKETDAKTKALKLIQEFEDIKKRMAEAIHEEFYRITREMEPRFLSLNYSREILYSNLIDSSLRQSREKIKPRSKEVASYLRGCSELSNINMVPLAHSSAKDIFQDMKPTSVKATETPRAPIRRKCTTGVKTPQIFRRPGIGEAAVSTAGSPLIVSENISAPLLSVPTVDGKLVALIPPLDDSASLVDDFIPRVAPPVRRQLEILQKYITQVLRVD